MSKFRIAVLVLLTVAVAVAVLPLMKVAYDEFYFKPWYESLTPIKKEYAHPTPFFATWYGFGTIAVWACLGFVWLTYSIVKLKQSKKIVFKGTKRTKKERRRNREQRKNQREANQIHRRRYHHSNCPRLIS